MSAASPPDVSRGDRLVDAQNPWPGLHAFTEELSGFFFGRSDEADELLRRVRRNIVTVLFGQSGLGKTSLLRAGLSPRLRAQGFLPVFVRLDHAAGAPPATTQMKAALRDALQASARPGTVLPVETATLWEYLHRTDVEFMDRDGQALQPVFILDQFEELFTLGQDGDAPRARRLAFIGELAGLIENRSPAEVKRRLESDSDLTDHLDFDRQPYRILLSLREDYLAHLQELQAQSPSVAQNLMRLTRMNGRQALAAVIEPGGGLVSDRVGRLIVQFVSEARRSRRDGETVSGITGLAELEVEPSLLSLVCRELNNRRLALGLAEITPELTDRSREEILSDFYDRSFDELPPERRDAVRAWVEDELVTDSGFRENVALERAEKALAALGAPGDTIEILRRRRLLRIEERLRVQRVELIHDVLIEPVRRSREERQQRQAVLEAQRREEELRARQQAAAEESRRRERELQGQLAAKRRQVRQVRMFALGMTFLALLAGASFWYSVRQRKRFTKQTELAVESIQAMGQYLQARADSNPAELRPVYGKYLAEMGGLLDGMQRANPGTPTVLRLLAYYAAFQSDLSLKENERARADSTARLAEARAGELARRKAEPESREAAMLTYGMIATTLKDLDSLQRARAAIDSALALALAIDTASDARAKSRLAIIYDVSGDVRWAQHDSIGALNAYRQRLLVRQALAAGYAGDDQLRELAAGLETYGWILRNVDSLGPAAAMYDSAIAVQQHRLAASADSAVQRDGDRRAIRYAMAWELNRRGQVEADLKQPAAARASYTQAIAILDSVLAEYPDNNRYRRTLASALSGLADLAATSDPGLALRSYERMVDLYVSVAGRTGMRDDLVNLAWGYGRLGSFLLARKDRTGALRMYQSRADVAGRLVRGDSSAANLNRLANALGSLAWVEVLNNRPREAEQAALEAIAADSTEYFIYTNLTHAYLMTNRYAEAVRTYDRYKCNRVNDSTFAFSLTGDFRELAAIGLLNANMRRLDAIARAETCPRGQAAAGTSM